MTFYEAYQQYLQLPGAIPLGKKQYKKLHSGICFYFNKWNIKNLPLKYRDAEYEGQPIQVRDYPPEFSNKLNSLIINFCIRHKKNMAIEDERAKKREAKLASKKQQKPAEKQKRKRIPVSSKPAFSLKK